jgi:HEAT repeat protein
MKLVQNIALGALLAIAAGNAVAQDAESVYAEARRALNRLEFDAAIAGFQALRNNFPDSRYVSDSYYWEAFALERTGDLGGAVEAIDTLLREHPDAATRADAQELKIRSCMELARQGNRECAEEISSAVRATDEVDEEVRLAAVNALMYLPAERAVPIAARLVANREQPLTVRKQALFILADTAHEPVATDQVREVLKAVALDSTDDAELRGQAVFWLSQTPGEDTLALLEELVNGSSDRDLQTQAVFAISQHEPAQSLPLLERVVRNEAYDMDIRVQALHWIGEKGGAGALPFLTRTYTELADEGLKQQALFAVSQTQAPGATAWLAQRGGDPSESIDLRQQALFFAAQSGLPAAELGAIYQRTADPDLRAYTIWLIAERGGEGSLESLLEIARTDPDPGMREQAIQLIGSSEDPRAEEYLLQMLGERP